MVLLGAGDVRHAEGGGCLQRLRSRLMGGGGDALVLPVRKGAVFQVRFVLRGVLLQYGAESVFFCETAALAV